MKRLLKNAQVVNVFLDTLSQENVLIEDDKIIGVGAYQDLEADEVIDLTGKFLCPGFLDGHIHIESTALLPYEFAKVAIPHGTSLIVADPHEIVNVAGVDGLNFILETSKDLPLDFFFMLPSCVPATKFDESGARLLAKDLAPLYDKDRVIGLAEVMDYEGVIAKNPLVIDKINEAKRRNLAIDGHGPLLSGKRLDAYVAAGVESDHECSSFEEAKEKISKGQIVMIREGSAARNLDGLMNLFDEPYNHRTILATDDKHPHDLIEEGIIDATIRRAVKKGKSVFAAIRMASIQTAQYFHLKGYGAIAPGYYANILVCDDLNNIDISSVYHKGKLVYQNHELLPFPKRMIDQSLFDELSDTMHVSSMKEEDFLVHETGKKETRVMGVIAGQLITKELHEELDFDTHNGINLEKDILKIANIERHHNTGHYFVGYIHGIGLKEGAIATSVAHDSHNVTIIGTNEKDMAFALDELKRIKGGQVFVKNGKLISEFPMKIAGVMSGKDAIEASKENEELLKATYECGVSRDLSPFMLMSFLSLTVIPELKITTKGYVNVIQDKIVPLLLK